jgi:hypothetical protein
MEERKVTAISYKDKLIRYIIPVSEQVSDKLNLC